MRSLLKYVYCFVFFICLLSLATSAQGIADDLEKSDTVKINNFRLDANLLFLLSNDEMDRQSTLDVINTIFANYIVKKSDIDLYLRQKIEWGSDGDRDKKHLIVLSSGLWKYRNLSKKRMTVKHFYPEVMAIYQNNSDRGLENRFQAGLLLHPFRYHGNKFRMNLGLGVLYDWSSWRVNDAEKIAGAAPELRDKIEFINAHTELKDNMFQLHSEWRPTLRLQLIYELTEQLEIHWSTAFQQSLTSPYNASVRAVYPELGNVYPYILSRMDLVVRVYKNLALSFSAELDYENNNLALYDSSWSYGTLCGIRWTFSGQNLFRK